MKKTTLVILLGVCLSLGAIFLPGSLFDKNNLNKEQEEVMVKEHFSKTIIIKSEGFDLKGEALEVIETYFDRTMTSLSMLESQSITDLFLDSNDNNALLNQNALNFLISLRKARNVDLKINDYEITAKILDKVEGENGRVEITIIENNRLNFNYIPERNALSAEILHRFVLIPVENDYKIAEHYKEEDSFILCEEVQAQGLSYETLLEFGLTSIEKQNEERALVETNIKNDWKIPTHGYNREKAVEYAQVWAIPENADRNSLWGLYDFTGGNCNNFISQCLFEGGIPRDYFGENNAQWKWYDEEFSWFEEPSGYTDAWVGVEEFWIYANLNADFGLVADTNINPFLGEKGDILQLGALGEWRHSVIISEVIKDSKGKVVDYLIDSNTTDRLNYPVSAYGYPEIRLIKIHGWNE
ncbi:MAG: amidase domain-containing protein [Eubacteriaceae bacterium]